MQQVPIMRPNKDTVISWGYVFKITFPNGKIYVGSDTATTARTILMEQKGGGKLIIGRWG